MTMICGQITSADTDKFWKSRLAISLDKSLAEAGFEVVIIYTYNYGK